MSESKHYRTAKMRDESISSQSIIVAPAIIFNLSVRTSVFLERRSWERSVRLLRKEKSLTLLAIGLLQYVKFLESP